MESNTINVRLFIDINGFNYNESILLPKIDKMTINMIKDSIILKKSTYLLKKTTFIYPKNEGTPWEEPAYNYEKQKKDEFSSKNFKIDWIQDDQYNTPQCQKDLGDIEIESFKNGHFFMYCFNK